MVMPKNFILVRHGQSEANVIQKQVKSNPTFELPNDFYQRHDSLTRLSELGVEQAIAAGNWLRANNLDIFDRAYVSPHVRACETAAHLDLNINWLKDDRWRERDWGEYGMVNEAVREQIYPHSNHLKSINGWYWCPPGGESLATGVRERFSSILGTLHREAAGEDVIAVTHGETIRVAQFVIERQTPSEWLEEDENEEYKVQNTQIIHYTRVNPVTGELDSKIRWRRSICPWDETKSWNNGEWVQFDRFSYSNKDLLESVNKVHRLL